MTVPHMVYLDYAASAPMRPEALAAEKSYEQSSYAGANPNSLHTLGRTAARELDRARAGIARAVGGGFRPGDVVLTSGGTESNNLAILGISEAAREHDRARTRVVISAIEHDSILDLAPGLRARGFEVDVVKPGRDGRVSTEGLEAVLGPQTALVSVMSANNETGVLQDVRALCEASHAVGALFHTDAVQAFGRVPLAVEGADAVSVAAHKIGGPVGVGALLVRGRCPLRPLSFGGGQEAGRRAGTQDVRGAVSFEAAARACTRDLNAVRATVSTRAERLSGGVCSGEAGIVPTTDIPYGGQRLPGIVSVMVPGIESESMILALDAEGFEVSAGSACSSGSLEPSHVLSAMGIDREHAFGSLRVSFDERVPEADLEAFGEALIRVVGRLRDRG